MEIVKECTDDTKLSKGERKLKQIEKAANCSHKVIFSLEIYFYSNF